MIDSFSGFFRGKKILLTGHTGFKGSWLSLWLTELGADVMGYALRSPTEPSLFEVLGLQSRLRHVIGDIRDIASLQREVTAFQPEVVIHMAAQPLVRLSYEQPALTYETNVMGVVNILDTVRKTKSIRTVVNVTTDKCYENREWVYGYRENEAMGGYDPYSSSKGCSELVTSAYRSSYFNPKDISHSHQVVLASARAGNVIGGGDWAIDRLIPDCIRALSKNVDIVVRNPESVRPWQHVLEPLSGYLWLTAKMQENPELFGSGWNFGPDDGDVLTVENVVKQVITSWGKGNYRINKEKSVHEAMLLKLDISKAKHYLQWRPVYHAAESVEQSVRWYREWHESGNRDMVEFTKRQISEFTRRAAEQKIEWAIN